MNQELIDLLQEAIVEIEQIWKSCDKSVADYVLSLETAYKFVEKSLQTEDRLDIFKALQKAYDVLEKEYVETPNEEDDNLADRIKVTIDNGGIYEQKFMKNNKVKSIITETVLKFLNEDKTLYVRGKFKSAKPEEIPIKKKLPVTGDFSTKFEPNPPKLKEEDKEKIDEIVKKTLVREGFMALTYGTDVESGKTYIGARIDPTNRGDWVLTKEELLYELPIQFNESLHSYVKDLRKRLTEEKK